MTERVMASIEVVEEVQPIVGADALDHYRVKGWWGLWTRRVLTLLGTTLCSARLIPSFRKRLPHS